MSPCVGFNTEAQRSQRRTELSPNCDRSGAGLRPTFGYEEIRIRETSGTRDSSHGSGSLHTQHRASAVPDLQSCVCVFLVIRMSHVSLLPRDSQSRHNRPRQRTARQKRRRCRAPRAARSGREEIRGRETLTIGCVLRPRISSRPQRRPQAGVPGVKLCASLCSLWLCVETDVEARDQKGVCPPVAP